MIARPLTIPGVVSVWVIYWNPSDFPDRFVVRRHELVGVVSCPKEMIGEPCESIEEARMLIPAGCRNIGRENMDDLGIYEVWV